MHHLSAVGEEDLWHTAQLKSVSGVVVFPHITYPYHCTLSAVLNYLFNCLSFNLHPSLFLSISICIRSAEPKKICFDHKDIHRRH